MKLKFSNYFIFFILSAMFGCTNSDIEFKDFPNNPCKDIPFNLNLDSDTTLLFDESEDYPTLIKKISVEFYKRSKDTITELRPTNISLRIANSEYVFEQYPFPLGGGIRVHLGMSIYSFMDEKTIRKEIKEFLDKKINLKLVGWFGKDKIIFLDKKMKSKKLKEVFEIINNEYNKRLNLISFNSYKKWFCDLSNQLQESIKLRINFKFHFSNFSYNNNSQEVKDLDENN